MAEWQRWKNIMKAVPFEEKRLAKWSPPYIVQPKYDGFRCRAVKIENGYLLLSSEENIFYSVPHINEAVESLGMQSELDGELYCHGMSFDTLSSIVSRTVNIHPGHDHIEYHVFDVVNSQPQIERLLFIEKLKDLNKYIKVSPFWICHSLDDIMRTYDKILALGYEGIIVRHLHNAYERKRSIFVMKFKPKKEDDYEIVGVVEELSIDKTPKDQLGALVCSSGDGNVFSVGTGFSEEERKNLWDIKEALIGMNAKIQYQHLTSGRNVPRFPVFVKITS